MVAEAPGNLKIMNLKKNYFKKILSGILKSWDSLAHVLPTSNLGP